MILNHGDNLPKASIHFLEMKIPKCPAIPQWGRTTIEQTITSSTLQTLFMMNMDFTIGLNGYRKIGSWIPIP